MLPFRKVISLAVLTILVSGSLLHSFSMGTAAPSFAERATLSDHDHFHVVGHDHLLSWLLQKGHEHQHNHNPADHSHDVPALLPYGHSTSVTHQTFRYRAQSAEAVPVRPKNLERPPNRVL